MINRGLVIALAKEPFREWLRSLPDPEDLTLEEINEDCSAYLIPEWADDKQKDSVIKRVYPGIFENQLSGWWTAEKDWPKKRDLKTFRLWFDLRFHSIVEDLVDDILIDD